MVITILGAEVASQNWERLEMAFKAAGEALPLAIRESILAQNAKNLAIWRILTVWESQEALDSYRDSVDTPEGVRMFRAVETEPTLSIFHVRHQLTQE